MVRIVGFASWMFVQNLCQMSVNLQICNTYIHYLDLLRWSYVLCWIEMKIDADVINAESLKLVICSFAQRLQNTIGDDYSAKIAS